MNPDEATPGGRRKKKPVASPVRSSAAEQRVRTYPALRRKPTQVPVRVFDGGAVLAVAANLRTLAY